MTMNLKAALMEIQQEKGVIESANRAIETSVKRIMALEKATYEALRRKGVAVGDTSFVFLVDGMQYQCNPTGPCFHKLGRADDMAMVRLALTHGDRQGFPTPCRPPEPEAIYIKEGCSRAE